MGKYYGAIEPRPRLPRSAKAVPSILFGKRIIVAALLAVSAVSQGPYARAQCQLDWQRRQAIPGIDGVVHKVLAWDPDGVGPAEEVLVVGGDFNIAGRELVSNIVTWDGSQWHPLDDLPGTVSDLIVYDGALIKCGMSGGLAAVARWTGSAWQPVGDGPANSVSTLIEYQGNLIAGGFFYELGDGTTVNQIAAWNGSTWQGLGGGLGLDSSIARIKALAVYGDELIAGGLFETAGGVTANNIARWNGQTWSALSGGFDEKVNALAVYQGELVAGGRSFSAGPDAIPNVARWNGAIWQSLGDGLDRPVLALSVVDGVLIAMGDFEWSGKVPVSGLVRWDGNRWGVFDNGTGPSYGLTSTMFQNELIVAGQFFNAGNSGANYIARWDGSQWNTLNDGTNASISAFASYDGGLVAGGNFGSIDGTRASRIARWDGTQWHALAAGIRGGVVAITTYNGDLIAGGVFTEAGGTEANNIARWDGKQWHSMGSGLDSLSWRGVTGVATLAVYRGVLVAGGAFSQDGGANPYFLAQWDGADWVPMTPGPDGAVKGLFVYDGDLIVGGDFYSLGAVEAFCIGRWDGFQWHAMDVGVGGVPYVTGVYGFAEYEGQLVAVGAFAWAGSTEAVGVARWDGSQWHPLGTEIKASYYPGPQLRTIVNYNGELIVGGRMGLIGQQYTQHLARWDGAAWQTLGGNTSGEVLAFGVYDGKLLIGGIFRKAGEAVSAYLATWASSHLIGDHDNSGTAALPDLSFLPACLSGPGEPTSAGLATEDCLCVFNGDGDADVDLRDVASILNAFDD